METLNIKSVNVIGTVIDEMEIKLPQVFNSDLAHLVIQFGETEIITNNKGRILEIITPGKAKEIFVGESVKVSNDTTESLNSAINRIEVIDEDIGRVFVSSTVQNAALSRQDNNETLKVFIKTGK